MDDVPDDVLLPCGCLLRCSYVNDVATLTVSPCSLTCRHLADLLDLSREEGIAPEFRRA